MLKILPKIVSVVSLNFCLPYYASIMLQFIYVMLLYVDDLVFLRINALLE